MLAALDAVIDGARPDWVLVYGDTNSTLAGALAAVKLHLPVAHLEAGLRSFNRRMPEEHNRVLTDHAADLLLAPTEVAMGTSCDEGSASRSVVVGDVMTDVCFRVRDAVAAAPPRCPTASRLRAGDYVAATLHRAENTDDPDRLRRLVAGAAGAAPARRAARAPAAAGSRAAAGISLTGGSLRPSPPCPTRRWSCSCLSAAWSPTPAACRRRHSSSVSRARRCAPRPSGSRPSRTAGMS